MASEERPTRQSRRKKATVDYTETERYDDFGLARFARAGVNNTHRSRSPQKNTRSRKLSRKYASSDEDTAKDEKRKGPTRKGPQRAGRAKTRLQEDSGSSDNDSQSQGSDGVSCPLERLMSQKRAQQKANTQAPTMLANNAAPDRDAEQKLKSKGNSKLIVMDESDSEAAGSDGYEPPAAAARQPRSCGPSSPSDLEQDSESENSQASDGAMSGEDQAWSGDKRKGRKGKARTATSRPTRQGTRPSHARSKGQLKVDSDSDQQTEDDDSDAMTDAEARSSSEDNSSDTDKGDHDAAQVRRSSRTTKASGRKSSGAQDPKQGLLDNAISRAKAQSAPAKPKAFRAELVEKVLDWRQADDEGGEELRVKMRAESYRQARWVPKDKVEAGKAQLVRNFMQRRAVDGRDEELVEGIHPDWLLVERVIGQHTTVRGTDYLIKWCGLGYAEATWMSAEALTDDQAHVERFLERQKPPVKEQHVKLPELSALPEFQNGRSLRDYQKLSLEWMMSNCRDQRNCILGDEMGLGKTAQSIAALEFQRQLCGRHGPFLVIAPLTTLGHWQREIETWTTMNVVVFAGSAADRATILEYEWRYSSQRQLKGSSKDSSTRAEEPTRLEIEKAPCNWLLLLSGTPVQNNMSELQGIMSLLDDERWGDKADFAELYGGDDQPPTAEQIQALQKELQPVLLRRMKEDVENLPEKEEVVVWVELTQQQRTYYKALYANQIGALLDGATSKNVPNLRNLAMELRKVCCHPFLCNGLEEDMAFRRAQAGAAGSELDFLIHASGKMVLLFKLLPKLRQEGKKVLVFSQFKIMLDVIEDALFMAEYPKERIDGSVASRERQSAIDRFSRGDDDSFVFLLSTRAGGQGITLTAADTVVIYDSDWNPQNDLQAMARCHRIGQSKDVTIYRLVCRDTYEAQIFQSSSRKYGLDEAILGHMGGTDPEKDGKRITELLKYGAHAIMAPEAEAAKAAVGEAFVQEDIAAILAGRTEKRQIGSRAGNTFSTATFSAQPIDLGGKDAQSFWGGLMPDALAQHNEQKHKALHPSPLGRKRERKAVVYNEASPMRGASVRRAAVSSPSSGGSGIDSGSSSDSGNSDSHIDEEIRRPHGSAKRVKAAKAAGPKQWSKAELKALEDRLICLGPNHPGDLAEQAGIQRSHEDIAEVKAYLLRLVEKASASTKSLEAQRRSALVHMYEHLQENGDRSQMGNIAQSVASTLLSSMSSPPPPQAERAFGTNEVLLRLAKAASKYKDQFKLLSELNTFMFQFRNGDEDANSRMDHLLTCLQYDCTITQWTSSEDQLLLNLVHRLGWASFQQSKCAQVLINALQQHASTLAKVTAQAAVNAAGKLDALIDEESKAAHLHKLEVGLISKRVNKLLQRFQLLRDPMIWRSAATRMVSDDSSLSGGSSDEEDIPAFISKDPSTGAPRPGGSGPQPQPAPRCLGTSPDWHWRQGECNQAAF
ncbi:hypothetical protein WJX73_007753 [Symbiochloris irregularis]|uniref:Uncharacterized protein n=1 Tax=Symbiochloris irregularis TaxID=706552 RepID=A0AAW1NP09_9CHLO